ncbi:5'-methylthioadenosine/S-adenosylhomocysteine nucleosidase [compost metagenome]
MRRVNVLIVEDEDGKRDKVAAEIADFFGKDAILEFSDTFADATQRIIKTKYDLIIVDLLLPRRKGDKDPVDVSEEIIDHLANSDVNRMTTVVAISRFGDVVTQRRGEFAKAGIFLINYSHADEWKSCLRVCMQRVEFNTVYDFVVVCALEIERSAFQGVTHKDFEYGELATLQGLDVRELRIGDLRGVCVLQPRMGLVDASIITARALDAFNPKLICMAGICGGFSDEVNLGALLISDITWEHQAGKWNGSKFEIRSYHESIGNDTRTILSQMIQRDQKLTTLASKPHEIQVPTEGAYIRPTVSGSAVIASADYAQAITTQHGKVAGVDMEVYGVHRAAALHGQPVICFAAKTVVDHADEAKDSKLQQAGAILSARFVIQAIAKILI